MDLIVIPNGANGVKAEYREQVVSDYRGNPFIEALPPIYSKDMVYDKLGFYPPYSNEERYLDGHYRVHMVQRLFECFQPLSRHFDLESAISRTIRQGYKARNPFTINFAKSFHNGYELVKNPNKNLSTDDHFRSTASGFSIIGSSGMGKTTAINRILSSYPQIIVHSKYKGMDFTMYQLAWLKIECPYDGSLKGICIEFFKEVDNLLGTDYLRKFVYVKQTAEQMLAVMSQISRNCGLGLLVVDEIQNLSMARSGGSEKALNFFVTLINTIGIPVILCGTLASVKVLQGKKLSQGRRGSGQGGMTWDRLKKDTNWDLIINAIWDYQWTRTQTDLTTSMNDVLYEESQGIIDIAVKLYAMAQTRAILSGKETISVHLIRQVAKDGLKLVRPMLEALKSGDKRKLAQYEDIYVGDIDFDEFLNEEKKSWEWNHKLHELQKEAIEKKKKNALLTKKEEAIIKLIELDIEAKKAERVLDNLLGRGGSNLSVNELVIEALKIISSSKDEPQVKTSIIRKEQDLRFLIEKGKSNQLNAHQILKENGIIKDIGGLI